MHALLVFMTVSAFLGVRSHRGDSPIAHYSLLALCVLLAIAFTSRRVV